ncbi:MAG: O-acetyl-ADP-ribose deacetylase [Bacteroidetes bacterium]|nr:O-acetyl-ADP-ribose deacetylase [Bacteroidota bacterium]
MHLSTWKDNIEIIRGDITTVKADAIVNAANTSLLGGGGVDGAIHRAGGNAILEECRKIVARQGGCKTVEAVITTAGKLNARYVIHTVGPVWNGGSLNEKEKLSRCYHNSLQLAVDHDCKSIAFPCISTGVYRFPPAEAAKVAVDAIHQFMVNHSELVAILLVCFDQENFDCLRHELRQKGNE